MIKLITAVLVSSLILFSCENRKGKKHQEKERPAIIVVPNEIEGIHPIEGPKEKEKIDFQEEFEKLKKRKNDTSYRDGG